VDPCSTGSTDGDSQEPADRLVATSSGKPLTQVKHPTPPPRPHKPSREEVGEFAHKKLGVIHRSVLIVTDVIRSLRSSGALWKAVVFGILARLSVALLSRLGRPQPTTAEMKAFRRCMAGSAQACGSRWEQLGFELIKATTTAGTQLLVAVVLVRFRNARSAENSGRAALRPIDALVGALIVGTTQYWANRNQDGLRWVIGLALAFVLAYLLSYLIPTLVLHNLALPRATLRAISVIRTTWDADLLSWSAIWITSGVLSLLATLPSKTLDWFSSASTTGPPPRLLLILNLVLAVPAEVVAEAVSAGFVTVIIWTLRTGSYPEGFRAEALDVVLGSAAKSIGPDTSET
jgi:hypothetical protein